VLFVETEGGTSVVATRLLAAHKPDANRIQASEQHRSFTLPAKRRLEVG
jgi:hypothetical protein